MSIPKISNEIIAKAKQNDIAAFESIVLFYERPVFYFTLKHLNNREDAEDITQEIFIKLQRKLKQYREGDTFNSWLFKMALNTIYDELRRKKRQSLFSKISLEKIINLVSVREDEKIARKIDIGLCLRRIKPNYRKILVLFYLEGQSYKEIAKCLGMPINSVKTYLFRAKRAFRANL